MIGRVWVIGAERNSIGSIFDTIFNILQCGRFCAPSVTMSFVMQHGVLGWSMLTFDVAFENLGVFVLGFNHTEVARS